MPAGSEPPAIISCQNHRIWLYLRLRPGRKIWTGIFAVLALACGTPATQGVAPTAIAIPTVAVAPTSTIPPTPDTPTVPPGGSAPLAPAGPLITVGEAVFRVELAATPEKRTRGLSGRPGLDAGSGMLFVFDSESRVVFWMREMQFALDFVWIGPDCTVADISEGVPAPPPGMDLSDLPRYQPAVPVRYVLEINSGEIAASGITRGDPVGFGGSLTERYSC